MFEEKDLKVCLVTPEFPPHNWGGLSRTVANVADHLLNERVGLEVHVAHLIATDSELVLLDENRVTESSTRLVVHRILVGRESFFQGIQSLWECPHTLTLRMMYQSLDLLHQKVPFDLFHSFFLYPVGYVTGLLARRYGKKHIATIVGNDINKYAFSPEKAFLCANALSNADYVVALSQDLVNMADALIPIRDRACVIHNSVSIPSRSWKPQGRKDRFVIGFAGIFKYAKGLPYLMKAVSEMRKTGPAEMDLLGHVRDSEQRAMVKMIEKTGLGEALTIRPPVNQGEVPQWLRGLDAFVLPSISEGCPNILMEAMACGVPVVATKVGAVPDLVEQEKSGLLVPWGDAEALAQCLNRLRADPGLAASLGRTARDRMKRFSRDRERDAWVGLYKERFHTNPQRAS